MQTSMSLKCEPASEALHISELNTRRQNALSGLRAFQRKSTHRREVDLKKSAYLRERGFEPSSLFGWHLGASALRFECCVVN